MNIIHNTIMYPGKGVTLRPIGIAYTEAATAADSASLEVAWLAQYADLSADFARWQELSADMRDRMVEGVPTLQAANDALPETLAPLTNYKLVNTIQLKRVTGEPWTPQEQAALTALAYSCPLEAGKAVYRARALLRTWGNYVFDDTSICGMEAYAGVPNLQRKGTDLEVAAELAQWRIYSKPTQEQLWLEGPQGAKLRKIELYDQVGRIVLTEQVEDNNKQQIILPTSLSAGVYFLVWEQADGSRQTNKLIIEP